MKKHISRRPVLSLTICCTVALLCAGCMVVNLADLFTTTLQETTLIKGSKWSTSEKVLLVDVSGIMVSKAPFTWGESDFCTPDYIKSVLNKAANDPEIKAVILRVNSPGGEVPAIDSMSHELKQFSEKKNIPVYAMIMGLGCSGGYHITCPADRVYAQPSALIGGIGVILSIPRVVELADKIGFELVVFKSGKMKDMGNMFRDLSDEERKVFQDLVDDYYGQFLDWVVEGRSAFTSRSKIKPIADGRVYTARQAKENKLIDEVGYLDDVIADIKKEAKLKDAHIVTYTYRVGGDPTIYSSTSHQRPLNFNMLNVPLPLSLPSTKAGFYYMWQPGS